MNSLKPSLRSLVLVGTIAAGAVLAAGCVVAPAPPPYRPRPYVPPPPPPPPPADVAYNDQSAPPDEVRANEPPPPLPDYDQPPCPEDGYMWTPGYWAWGPGGYYWVPGTWVSPPRVGVLWTPPYWGFVGGVYLFHAGYWGPHVGFYGGVNYGFGYVGSGYAGGRWVGGSFAYNRAVTNVNVTVVHNTINETVVNNVTVNRVSYNGGPAGVRATASDQERTYSREGGRVGATPAQREHITESSRSPELAARTNGGNPGIAATARPAAFHGPGAVSARGFNEGNGRNNEGSGRNFTPGGNAPNANAPQRGVQPPQPNAAAQQNAQVGSQGGRYQPGQPNANPQGNAQNGNPQASRYQQNGQPRPGNPQQQYQPRGQGQANGGTPPGTRQAPRPPQQRERAKEGQKSDEHKKQQ